MQSKSLKGSNKLAIVLPHTGQPTETFIKRYFDEICPDRTVLVSFYRGADSWKFQGHCFCLEEQFLKNRNLYKAYRGIQKIAGIDSLFGDPFSASLLKRFLLNENVQVVFSQYLVTGWNVHGVIKNLGIRHIIRGHGFDLSSSLDDPVWCKRYQDLEDADGIVVPTPYQTNRLRNIGLKRVPIIEQPCGVDLPQNLTSRSEGSARPTRLLATGRMVAKKAPMILLKSFQAALSHVPDLELIWIGSGPMEAEVKAFISQHGLSDKIHLLGAVSHAIVLEEMQRADIFIQHSMTDPDTGDQEGAPVAILEAMAHGLPVISTIHSGIPYLVEDQVSGLLTPEGDFNAMARSIMCLSKEISKRGEMGKKGKDRVEHFTSGKEIEILKSHLFC
jgi:colanic acid/amylovoran biosynthesis glycosyltransferase